MLQQAVKLKQMKKQKASARKPGRVSKEQENIKKEANKLKTSEILASHLICLFQEFFILTSR